MVSVKGLLDPQEAEAAKLIEMVEKRTLEECEASSSSSGMRILLAEN